MGLKVYRVWCEWDVGQHLTSFQSKEAARAWVKDNIYLAEKECGHTQEELWDFGLVGVEEINVV